MAQGGADGETWEDLTEEQIRAIIERDFDDSKQKIDEIRQEIQVERLRNCDEKQQIDQREAELKLEREKLTKERKEFEENGGVKKVAPTQGLGLIVEEEVKRRLKDALDEAERER